MMESDALISRRKTKKIFVGNVAIGGDAPITVQSMTNTDTCDVKATCKQIDDLCEAGADIVRVSCPDINSVVSLKEIIRNSRVPIVADIHYNHKLAIEAAKLGVGAIRINPGNIGNVSRVSEVVKAAKDNNCSIRIGVNAGSLEKKLLEKYKEPCPEAMLESAIDNMRYLEDLDFFEFKISVKASNYFLAVKSYELLSEHCDYPLHLGVTEAGTLRNGTVLSAMGIGYLLSQGIGDTIRVSLSADPVEEIKVGYSILKSLNLRHRGVKIISCPSCARQGFDVISIVQSLEEALDHIRVPLTLSVLGCVVNGPGEAKHVDVGLVGGGKQQNVLYLDGSVVEKIQNKDIIKRIVSEIEEKAAHFESVK